MDQGHLGVAIVSATFALISKIVFDWLKGNKNGKSPQAACYKQFEKTRSNIEWLKEIHDQKDEDGVPKWYIPRSLIKLAREAHEKNIVMVEHLKDIRDILKENQMLLRGISKNGRV